MTLHALLAATLLLLSLPAQAASAVIPVHFRLAEEVLPAARAVVGEQGKVSAYGSQLVVSAPEPVIAELRQVLAQLDSEPKRLLISVDTRSSIRDAAGGHAIDGSARIGKADTEAGGALQGPVRPRIIQHNTASRDTGIQQVQASEGYPALIRIGQSVPLSSSAVDPYGQPYRMTEYRDLSRGFYATATVSGDRVQVSISSARDRLSARQPGVVDMQSLDTRVSGRVGEWITLGAVDEGAGTRQSATLRHYSTQGQQDLSLRLKVDILD